MVDELTVACAHKAEGCTWTGLRHTLGAHVDCHCLYEPVVCSLPGCVETVPRGRLECHVRECGHGLSACEVCETSVKNKDIEAHASECPGSTTLCPDCHDAILRATVSEHSTTCPETAVSCTHLRYGCPWEGKRRDYQAKHKAVCPFEAIKGFFVLNDQRMEAVAQENRDLRNQLAVLSAEIAALRECPPLPLEPVFVPPIVEETADRIGQLLVDTDHLRSELTHLNAGFLALEMRQDMALLSETARLREEMYSVRALCQAVQSQLLSFALDRRKESSSAPSTTTSVLSSAFNALAGGTTSSAPADSANPSSKKDTTGKPGVIRADSNSTTKL
ncbi:hypothetical protein PhCBS80983_g06106 [Powellomyces hirtus]|uniref:TRAF-type domain-containing protein n=1 Tax=Powellomyces hirtus TaxID=109895 RepID=A0A507DR64_9FUNG|nr:hypothetical protein PhCBS80983_g06106 [Powellomyces hirtus]